MKIWMDVGVSGHRLEPASRLPRHLTALIVYLRVFRAPELLCMRRMPAQNEAKQNGHAWQAVYAQDMMTEIFSTLSYMMVCNGAFVTRSGRRDES
jgi:hypothetical protein